MRLKHNSIQANGSQIEKAYGYIADFRHHKDGDKPAVAVAFAKTGLSILQKEIGKEKENGGTCDLQQKSIYLYSLLATQLSEALFDFEKKKSSGNYTEAFHYAKVARECLEKWMPIYHKKYETNYKKSIDGLLVYVERIRQVEEIFLRFSDLAINFKDNISNVEATEVLSYLGKKEVNFHEARMISNKTLADLEYLIAGKHLKLNENQLLMLRFLKIKLHIFTMDNQVNHMYAAINAMEKYLQTVEDILFTLNNSLENFTAIDERLKALNKLASDFEFPKSLKNDKQLSMRYEDILVRLENAVEKYQTGLNSMLQEDKEAETLFQQLYQSGNSGFFESANDKTQDISPGQECRLPLEL